ncbi:hypothetical protein THAOC_37769 [Thalassiosira oceanica]|uniref:Uncharacterized protein n=1 Tax=Thalassiosira oceanica TaxID=159749 RepID=K0QYG4_THAOC|nr:hypothetical protein THAOC_37769 [Thalassiosira oceanica]|eukprot:EJK43755.1 hypothetical protein THAOC_37769 [Thalassiosira oceanica]
MFVDYDSTLGINDAKFSCICYYGAGQTPAAEDVDFSPLDAILKRERISITKGIVTGHFGWGKPKFTGVLNRGKHTLTNAYKGKIDRPRAIFATPIRGFIGDDAVEDEQNPYAGSDGTINIDAKPWAEQIPYAGSVKQPWEGGIFFALSSKINAGLSVAMTSFGPAALGLTRATIPAYSFVSSDAMGKLFGDSNNFFLTGVVSPQGLLLDGKLDRVSVSRHSEGVVNVKFKPTMSGNKSPSEPSPPSTGSPSAPSKSPTTSPTSSPSKSTSESSPRPTVVLFPVWYKPDESTSDDVLPQNSLRLVTAVKGISAEGFAALVDRNSPVGFNFLAIGPDTPTTNVKHGIVYECTDDASSTSSFNGISHGNEGDCSSTDEKLLDPSPEHKGVLLNFDQPFSDIPAVIATPIYGPERDESSVRCIVESISVSSARVKCGRVALANNLFKYKPIPFTFVAVGATK